MNGFLPDLFRMAMSVAVILAGIQNWWKREVTDWLSWPPFLFGGLGISVAAVRLSFLHLTVSILLMIAWYYSWMGGADARMLIGLWGLWPLAGFLGILATGLWGLVLMVQKRGKEKIPALVGSAYAVAILFIIELNK